MHDADDGYWKSVDEDAEAFGSFGIAPQIRHLKDAGGNGARSPAELPIEWGEEIGPRLSSLWLIKRTLVQQGCALIYGHPGSGKSFLAIDMAMHVALGWDWNGQKTRKGVVVYVGAEGQNGLRNRIVAFKLHHGLSGPIPLALIPTPIDLHEPTADRAALARAVRRAAEHYGEPVTIEKAEPQRRGKRR